MTTLEAQNTHRSLRHLRPWLAALMCLVTPGLGLFYDGLFGAGLVVSLLSAAGFVAFVFLPELGLLSLSGIAGLVAFQAALIAVSMIAAAIVAWRRRTAQTYFWNDFYGLLFVTMVMSGAIEVPWQLIGLPVEAFSIPAGSMVPALQIDDQVMALRWNKVNRLPRRGEIVIFRLRDGRTDYVKRVVGLPGDQMQLKQNVVYVNGEAWPQKPLGKFAYLAWNNRTLQVDSFEERSPDGIVYRILAEPGRSPVANTPVYNVPAGHFFVLGDNRDNSQDSRFSEIGFVPLENLRALPLFFYYTLDGDRIGADVQ